MIRNNFNHFTGTKQDTRQDTKDDKNVVELKRELNLLSACNLIISSIIGTGIFVSPSAILSYSGSVGLSLVIWVISGILSLLGKYKQRMIRFVLTDKGFYRLKPVLYYF